MIKVTEKAKQELKKLLSEKIDNPLALLRLTQSDKGLGLILDVEMAGDKIVEHEDAKILAVEETLADRLENVTLDVEDTSEGPELVIVRESSS